MANGRAVWLAIMVQTAAGVGVAAGFLSWRGGMNVAQATLAGATAFGGSLALLITVGYYLSGPGSPTV